MTAFMSMSLLLDPPFCYAWLTSYATVFELIFLSIFGEFSDSRIATRRRIKHEKLLNCLFSPRNTGFAQNDFRDRTKYVVDVSYSFKLASSLEGESTLPLAKNLIYLCSGRCSLFS